GGGGGRVTAFDKKKYETLIWNDMVGFFFEGLANFKQYFRSTLIPWDPNIILKICD
ncbi:hypothetical protein ACJX0J_017512, partial [Zea mays]